MSRDFTDDERTLLHLLTAGKDPTAKLARAQVEAARFLSYWGPGDQSFDVEPAQGITPLSVIDGIYAPSDKYFTLASGEQGGVMLWVKSGLINSLEVYWYADPISRLPRPDEVEGAPPIG